MHWILRWRGGGGGRPEDSEMESSCGSCSEEGSFARKGKAKKKKGRGLLASFLDLFRKSAEEPGGFFVPRRRRRSESRGRDCYPVGRWLGKTASLHRFQVPSSKSQADPATRKREYPATPPRPPPPPPPKVSTSPPRRRRRRNRSGGSQFSLFSISLEQKSRSMQSLLQGARGGDSQRV